MELLLIRHGLPERLVSEDGTPADPPLSAKGRDQAERVARWLEGVSIDRLYSSPLLRARQTAQPLATLRGLPVEIEAGVREFDADSEFYIPMEELKEHDYEQWKARASGSYAAEADFLCVGTNDLTQHLLAVDRTNARVTRFFDHCHPALVRALHAVSDAARRAGKSLSICGETASNPLFLPLWLALGTERLSVHARRAGVLRALEAQFDEARMDGLLEELLQLTTGAEIRARLEGMAAPAVLEYVAARKGQ